MAIQKDIVINRKRYDHNQMNNYVKSIYKSGFEDGKAAVPGIDIQYIADIVCRRKKSCRNSKGT